MNINIDPDDINPGDFVAELTSAPATEFIEALEDGMSEEFNGFCHKKGLVYIRNDDDAEYALETINGAHTDVLVDFMESRGWKAPKEADDVKTPVWQAIADLHSVMSEYGVHLSQEQMHDILSHVKPPDIFEYLVLQHDFWLKSNKDQGGGSEYIAKMCGIKDNRFPSPEDCWDSLVCDHKEFLGQKIGELVLKGQKNA